MDSTIPYFSQGTYIFTSPICFALFFFLNPVNVIVFAPFFFAVSIAFTIFREFPELLIATTSSDEINILSCLVAKKLGIPHTIARVRNPEYEKQLRFMREELGLSMAINPEKAAAREIARVLRFPTAMKVESFSKGRLELVEYRVKENSALDGVQLLNLYKSLRVRVLICAVSRKGETIIPSGDFVLRAGDKIYLTSSSDQLAQFFRQLFSVFYAVGKPCQHTCGRGFFRLSAVILPSGFFHCRILPVSAGGTVFSFRSLHAPHGRCKGLSHGRVGVGDADLLLARFLSGSTPGICFFSGNLSGIR